MEKSTRENELKQKYYNYLQICLYRLMEMEGTVEDEDDYCKRIAPVIEMVRDGVLFYQENGTGELRKKVASLMKK